MRESVTYQAILEEGREEGTQLGRLAEACRMLVLLGRKRFGAPSAEISAALERLERVEEAEQLIDRILHVESWADLLGSETAE